MTCAIRTRACSWLEVSTPRSSVSAWAMRASRSRSTLTVTSCRASKRTRFGISTPGWRVVPDHPDAQRPGRRGQVAFSLRSSDLLELVVNVMQNGWTPEEVYHHIAHSDRPVMSFAECAC